MPERSPKAKFDWSHRHWIIRPLWLRNLNRRHRWLLRGILAIPAILIIALVVLTHSPITRRLVLSEIRKAADLEVDADSVSVQMDGDIVLERARFRIPGVAGPQGEFLKVAHIEAKVDWWPFLTSGAPEIKAVRMVEPVVIISQSTQDASLNIGSLKAKPGGTSGGNRLPPITLTRASIEIGEHDGDIYTPLRHVVLDGWFKPAPQDPDAFAFSLHESTLRPKQPDKPSVPGMTAKGSIGASRIEIVVEDFNLDEWAADALPSRIREVFADLALQGDIRRSTFIYTAAGGITAQLALEGVAMNLPLDPANEFGLAREGAEGPLPQFMRMRGVTGTITLARDRVDADVTGRLEDLPYNVKLVYDGVTEDAPFTCDFRSEGFRLQKSPRLLPYAPPKVHELLGLFSSPTAVVDTKMKVRRDPPSNGKAGPVLVEGTVQLHDGSAAYAKFPYSFEHMEGEFRFDNDKVEIVSVQGRSASGASLSAHGLITPLDDTSEVSVWVDVRNAPIDSAMEKAFGPLRDDALSDLFDTAEYLELVDAGLVQTPEAARTAADAVAGLRQELAGATPERAAGLQARLDEAQRRAAVPSFDFRGQANVQVYVHSPRGRNAEYEVVIDIDIPVAGLVPKEFPLPIVARGVKVHVENDRGELKAGTFQAVGGGDADITAAFSIGTSTNPESAPDIWITAHDLPFSPLLIHAIPGSDGDRQAQRVKQILTDLNVSALANGRVHIARREPGRPIGYDVDIGLSSGRIAPIPAAGAGPIAIDSISGRFTANEHSLQASIGGTASLPAASSGSVQPAPISASIQASFPREADSVGSYRADIRCTRADLALNAETLINVFAPGPAQELARLRREYEPRGPVDLNVHIESRGEDQDPLVQVHGVPSGELSAAFLGDRLSLAAPTGTIRIEACDGWSLVVEGVEAPVFLAGGACGRLTVSGAIAFERPPDPASAPLTATIAGLRLESELVRRLAHERLSADMSAAYDAYHPEGEVLARLIVRPALAKGGRAAEGLRISTIVEPRTLVLHPGDTRVEFPSMSGQIEVEGSAGIIRALTAHAPAWSLAADGAWDQSTDGSISLRTQLSGQGQSLTPDFRAMLPEDLRDVLTSLDIKIDGPFRLEESTLALARTPARAADSTRFTGAMSFAGASLDAGADLTELSGRLETSFRKEGAAAPEFAVDITADGFRVSGVFVSNGRAHVQNGERAGEVTVSSATGDCYSGRLSARAAVTQPIAAGPKVFNADVQVSGVRVSPVLADLRATPQAPSPAQPGHNDLSRGMLDAELTLSGAIGQPPTRRGRGTIRANGGRVLDFPLMMRLVEVSNLVLPANAGLDFARSSFFVDGELITFEDISVFSQAVQILGYGTMTWPGETLNLRFNSRSARPIPVVSTLLQGIRDELVTTVVTGNLSNPQVRLQQFPGTRRMLDRAIGSGQSEEMRRMELIERRAGSGPRAIRPSAPGISPSPPSSDAASAVETMPVPDR